MKIRRTFGASGLLENQDRPNWIASIVPIMYHRTRNIQGGIFPINAYEKRIVGGTLLNLRYIPTRFWWAEVTTGIENEHGISVGVPQFDTSRAGFDDIVVATGVNAFPSKKVQCTIYGFAGFSTRRSLDLTDAQDAFVGTRFYSLAIGSEISYSFFNSLERACAIIFQNRLLHFFKRRFEPILPVDALLRPGNVTDLLWAVRYREKKDVIEVGYNPTFFTNQAILLPTQKIRAGTFVRQSVFMRYMHAFVNIRDINNFFVLGAGFFVARFKRFDTKIVSYWFNVSYVF